jgi:isoleucyl-tRNA synthetase
VANSDYYDDLRIGPEILQRQVDHYRRMRNTFRYLLGSLDGYTEAEKVDFADMPELERWVLARLHAVDAEIRKAIDGHDYHQVFTTLHYFCNNDLSAFYFDIRKDTLYCADPAGTERRACRTVMDQLFHCLVPWIAPILCFTAEEAWQTRFQDRNKSVHFEIWPDLPDTWADEVLIARWDNIRKARLVVNGAIEKKRADGKMKSSLLAHPHLYAPKAVIDAFDGLDAADIFITSAATLVAGEVPKEAVTLDDDPVIGAVVESAEGEKCQRCWKVLPEVGAEEDSLCGRCENVISAMGAT